MLSEDYGQITGEQANTGQVLIPKAQVLKECQ